MSKHQVVAKKNIKTAISAVILVAVCGAVYAGMWFFASTVEEKKTAATNKSTQDEGLLNDLRSQVNKSGEAAKRFAEISGARRSLNFSGTKDSFSEYLRAAKQHYRLDKMDLKLAKETVSTKPELQNFNYAVTLRPHLTLKFQAVSDVHVFSFLEDLQRNAPGVVRVEVVSLRRLSEMNESVLGQIPNGVAPLLVEATIDFTWINFVPKDKDKGTKKPTPPPAP